MEILVLGSGGREHALAWRLARDEAVRRVRISPGNGGTPAVAETVPDLDVTNPDTVARHAVRERYDLVVIGPEAPLAAGVADELAAARIPVFGPTRAAARLESSKTYAKAQMERAGVATAASASFTDVEAALEHVRAVDGPPPVIKADGLAAGKGVVVPGTTEEALAAVRELLGDAPPGARIVIEERLSGPEVSAFALVSGSTVVPLAAACDYKRLADGDRGPNTGGMGAYTPVPWFGPDDLETVVASVFEPIAWRMARDEAPYRGVLYAGLMLTADGPTVLEFNARFGDPEAQVLLPMLDGDLAPALLATANGDRSTMEDSLGLRPGAAVGVVVASPGYPGAPVLERPVEGAEPTTAADDGSALVFHAGTRRTRDGFVSSGGRVLTVVGRGADLATARNAALARAAEVRLDGAQLRTDIAAREVATSDGGATPASVS